MNSRRGVKVSIISTTYNQQNYIRQALESFIGQQTKFPFEVIIADDCSTDKTPEIIKEFADKYPDIIKPILRTKNVGIVPNFLDVLRKAAGEYIAPCEGDDYWSDPYKLQKQVDFLESAPDYALCFHPVRVFFEDKSSDDYIFPEKAAPSAFNIKRLLQENFIQTNSVMYRKQNYEDIPSDIMPLDWFLHLYHAQFGKIGYLDEITADYRKHSDGVWWHASRNMDEIWKKHGLDFLSGFNELLKIYGKQEQLNQIINEQINNMFSRLIELDEKHGTNLVQQAMVKYPEVTKVFILNEHHGIKNNETTIAQLNKQNVAGQKKFDNLEKEYRNALGEIIRLQKTKSFRLGFYLLHPQAFVKRVAYRCKQQVSGYLHKLQDIKDAKSAERAYRKEAFANQKIDKEKNTKTAVVIHLFYTEMWDGFVKNLQALQDIPFDLFITLPRHNASFTEEIKKDYPNAYIFKSPNRGRDVLPFMQAVSLIQEAGYEYLLKLHSKKSTHRTDGKEWLSDMTDKLLPSDPKIRSKLFQVLADKDTGVVGPAGHYMSLLVNYEANRSHFRNALARIKNRKIMSQIDKSISKYGFFAGTMFWVRMDAIKAIIDAEFKPIDFQKEKGQIDGTLAHALERLFCVIPELDGKNLYEIEESNIKNIEHFTNNIPEWSDLHPKNKKFKWKRS